MFLACIASLPSGTGAATVAFYDVTGTQVTLTVPRGNVRILTRPIVLSPKTKARAAVTVSAVVDCYYFEPLGAKVYLVRIYNAAEECAQEFEVPSNRLFDGRRVAQATKPPSARTAVA
ncbi:hypothetical protein HJC99_05920 [Candidatus Saccharibacteria bacterium]|nr:hypothetical protein [Candidatus Saccharibacteria bacterium]